MSPCVDFITVVIHARTGMLIKAPWGQYMVHLRAYPFKGLQFHGRQTQSWILYVLNTFPHVLSEVDVLNPAHHKHIAVGLCILFFEVRIAGLWPIMPIFVHRDGLTLHNLTQVGLQTRGMTKRKIYNKVFIEEVSAFEGQDWWADAARPFRHKHVVRPTVAKHKCYNVIDVARVLGPAMILRDPATPTVPEGALPRSAAERADRFQGVAEDRPCPDHGLVPPKNGVCRQCLTATKGSELYYLSAYATTCASYAHGGDDAEYKKEFRM